MAPLHPHPCAAGWSKQQAVGDFEIAETRRRWLQALRVLIIDECSMLSAEFLQYLVKAITRMRSESQEGSLPMSAALAMPVQRPRLPPLALPLQATSTSCRRW